MKHGSGPGGLRSAPGFVDGVLELKLKVPSKTGDGVVRMALAGKRPAAAVVASGFPPGLSRVVAVYVQ